MHYNKYSKSLTETYLGITTFDFHSCTTGSILAVKNGEDNIIILNEVSNLRLPLHTLTKKVCNARALWTIPGFSSRCQMFPKDKTKLVIS